MIKSLRKLFSTTYNKYIKIYFKWMLSIPRKKKNTQKQTSEYRTCTFERQAVINYHL